MSSNQFWLRLRSMGVNRETAPNYLEGMPPQDYMEAHECSRQAVFKIIEDAVAAEEEEAKK